MHRQDSQPVTEPKESIRDDRRRENWALWQKQSDSSKRAARFEKMPREGQLGRVGRGRRFGADEGLRVEG
jgi:hypothetical protein